MGCSRCGVPKPAPLRTLPRVLQVSATPTSKFSRISTMERFVAETPGGNHTLEVGKVYVVPSSQVKELQDNGAPIWVLK